MTGLVELLVNTSLTPDVPEPVAPPLIVAIVARVHEKVGLDCALVGVYVKVVPLQMATGVNVLLKTGVGLTTTLTFCPELEHELAVVVYE